MRIYRLVDDSVVAMDGDEKRNEWTLDEFIEDYLELPESLMYDLTAFVDLGAHSLDFLQDAIKEHVKINCKEIFKDLGDIKESKLSSIRRSYHKNFKEMAKVLQKELIEYTSKYVAKLLKGDSQKKKLSKQAEGEGNMFKTLKQAKKFTAHLDVLADEIQNLPEIDQQTAVHLAARLDKLSDVIEEESFVNEKKANGIGSGSWIYDADEEKYMSTMGGTGALQRDADEPYMDEFVGDDHKEVLERKEPNQIKDDGMKVKQPSDDYNEKVIADKLKDVIKEAVKEALKK